jgi:hypothetical protein
LPLGAAAGGPPLGVGCSFRGLVPPKYRPYWLGDPALPLAVSSAVRFSFDRGAGGFAARGRNLSSSLALRQSITQRTLAARPEPAGSSHGLLLPSAHEGSEVHLTRVCRARYVPPSGFGYPLDGLHPPSPCRFCLTPAALLGFTLRSFPLSQGIRCVSARKHPRAVSPAVAPGGEPTGRPGRPRLLGFDPCESPWQPDV